MYYDKNTEVYLNGKWIKATMATAGLYNQTLHYGNGVFEGIRVYETETGVQIFKAEEHFERLLKSAKLMHINFSMTVTDMINIAYELLERNGLKNAYIRPLIFLGENMSLGPVNDAEFFMCAWEWGKYLGDNLQRITVSPYCRPHPKSCHIEAKTVGHYTNSILASTEAKNRGYDEALLLDVNGCVAEGPGANFFYEKDGVLFTSPLGHILPGITRSTIIDLAVNIGIEIRQEFFKIDSIMEADSAFFVGTAAEVAGIKSIDNYSFPVSWEDSIGFELSRMYQMEVLGKNYKRFELV